MGSGSLAMRRICRGICLVYFVGLEPDSQSTLGLGGQGFVRALMAGPLRGGRQRHTRSR